MTIWQPINALPNHGELVWITTLVDGRRTVELGSYSEHAECWWGINGKWHGQTAIAWAKLEWPLAYDGEIVPEFWDQVKP